MVFLAENEVFQFVPSLTFFSTVALATVVLMRLLVQRGRVSAPARELCAPGRLALM